MSWYTVLVLCAGIAIVVYGADEAIKRLTSLSKFFRLSAFVTGVVIAGTLAVLPELSIGILSALDGTSTFGLGIILGANVADLTLVLGIVVLLAGNQKMTSGMIKNLKISFFAVLLFQYSCSWTEKFPVQTDSFWWVVSSSMLFGYL
ncbi:MAG: hypothetical protein ACBZ72_07840 [Candidatus Bathyarchaeia archaeon]|jgi:cation:H+ antiporter